MRASQWFSLEEEVGPTYAPIRGVTLHDVVEDRGTLRPQCTTPEVAVDAHRQGCESDVSALGARAHRPSRRTLTSSTNHHSHRQQRLKRDRLP